MNIADINTYILNNKYLIKHIAKQIFINYQGIILDYDDFIQEANLITIKLLKSFNKDKSNINTYVYNYLPKYLKRFSEFNSYSFKASYYDLMDNEKRNKIKQIKVVSIEDNIRFIEDKKYDNTDSKLDNKLKLELINKILDKYNIQNKELFKQLYFEQIPRLELANNYNITLAHINYQMSRAKKEIRTILKRTGVI